MSYKFELQLRGKIHFEAAM